MKININGKDIEIKVVKRWEGTEHKSRYCRGQHFWKYRIEVIYPKDDYSFRFTFSNSIADYNKGKTKLTDLDKINALWCALNDATAYLNAKDRLDFIREFGYEDWGEGAKVYDGCMNIYYDINQIFDDDEIYDAINYLSETYNL